MNVEEIPFDYAAYLAACRFTELCGLLEFFLNRPTVRDCPGQLFLEFPER